MTQNFIKIKNKIYAPIKNLHKNVQYVRIYNVYAGVV